MKRRDFFTTAGLLTGATLLPGNAFASTELKDLPLIELVPHLKHIGHELQEMYWMKDYGTMIDEAVNNTGTRKYYCLSAPRGAGKTVLNMATIIKKLLNEPNAKIGYISASAHMSKLVHRKTRNQMDELNIYPEKFVHYANYNALGQGQRYNFLIIDTPYKCYLDYTENSEHYNDIFEKDIQLMLEPDSTVIITSSRYGDNDLIKYVRNNYFSKSINVSAIKITETIPGHIRLSSYWEERYPWKSLCEIRNRNQSIFQKQFIGDVYNHDFFNYPMEDSLV